MTDQSSGEGTQDKGDTFETMDFDPDDVDSLSVESIRMDTVSIDFDAYPNITISHDGETYEVVEGDDGLELEVVTD